MLHLLCTLDFEFQFTSDLGADVYDDHRLRFHNINAQHTNEQTIGKVHRRKEINKPIVRGLPYRIHD